MINNSNSNFLFNRSYEISLKTASRIVKSLAEEKLKKQVWEKAIFFGITHDGKEIRIDYAGAFMVWEEYGKRTPLGWEIDHIIPKSEKGSEKLLNLQPLQWKNNRSKSDSCIIWESVIRGYINKERELFVNRFERQIHHQFPRLDIA